MIDYRIFLKEKIKEENYEDGAKIRDVIRKHEE